MDVGKHLQVDNSGKGAETYLDLGHCQIVEETQGPLEPYGSVRCQIPCELEGPSEEHRDRLDPC